MGILSHDDILELHAAAVSAHLVASRSALLSGIDRRFVDGLPHAPTPSDQILQDLTAMNDAGALADGSVPLAVWLKNALARAGQKKEAAILKAALSQCGGRADQTFSEVARLTPSTSSPSAGSPSAVEVPKELSKSLEEHSPASRVSSFIRRALGQLPQLILAAWALLFLISLVVVFLESGDREPESWLDPLEISVDVGPVLYGNDVSRIVSAPAGPEWSWSSDKAPGTVAFDRYGSKWFLGNDGKLSVLHPGRDERRAPELPVPAVAVAADNSGGVWALTKEGLYILEANETWVQKLAVRDQDRIDITSSGSIWLQGETGVKLYDPKSRDLQDHPLDSNEVGRTVGFFASDSHASLLIRSSHDHEAYHLNEVDTRTRQWARIDLPVAVQPRQLIPGAGSTAWLEVRDRAQPQRRLLLRKRQSSDKWETYDAGELAACQINGRYGDDPIWFATSCGLRRFHPDSETWSSVSSGNPFTQATRRIFQAQDGSLWFGGWQGTWQYNPSIGNWRTYLPKKGQVPSSLQVIVGGHNGSILMAGFDWNEPGVRRYDPVGGDWVVEDPRDDVAWNADDVLQDRQGRIWIAYPHQISRKDPSGTWKSWSYEKAGLPERQAFVPYLLAEDGQGGIWLGGKGLRRHDEATGRWIPVSQDACFEAKDGIAALVEDPGGNLWLQGRGKEGASGRNFDSVRKVVCQLSSGEWKVVSLDSEPGLLKQVDNQGALWFLGEAGALVYHTTTRASRFFPVDAEPLGLLVDDRQTLWLGTRQGIVRVPLNGKERGVILGPEVPPNLLATSGRTIIISGMKGLSFLQPKEEGSQPDYRVWRNGWSPSGALASAIAPGPDGAVWVGTKLGGLWLHWRDRSLVVTEKDGLPSMTVTALATIPGETRDRVWVGTTGGLSMVRIEQDALRVEATLAWEGMPPGPVDALAAEAQGNAFVAFGSQQTSNPRLKSRFADASIEEQRRHARVFRVTPAGQVREVVGAEALGGINAMVWTPDVGLWVATSQGLFVAQGTPREGGDFGIGSLKRVDAGKHALRGSISLLAVDPHDHHTVWTAGLYSTMTAYNSVSQGVYQFGTGETAWPNFDLPGFRIDGLVFDEQKRAIVMAGGKLFRGHLQGPSSGAAGFPSVATTIVGITVALLALGALVWAGFRAWLWWEFQSTPRRRRLALVIATLLISWIVIGAAVSRRSSEACVQGSCPHGMCVTEESNASEVRCVDEKRVSVIEFQECVRTGRCRPAGRASGRLLEKAREKVECNTGLPNHVYEPVTCVDSERAAEYCAWTGASFHAFEREQGERDPARPHWAWREGPPILEAGFRCVRIGALKP